MRITNNIITRNTKSNINSNKVGVDKYNTQMTTQKKIAKASEDPVIAIRSLRYSTTLSKLTQYADNNIPDAQSWLDVTQTALTNQKELLKDIRTICVSGSTDTKTADDRKTLLNQLTQLHDQVYEEGNADYGGRTVFTGYRTTSRMTFDGDNEMTYDIDECFTYKDFDEHRYYYGDVEVPLEVSSAAIAASAVVYNDGSTDIRTGTFQRIRLAYDNVRSITPDTDPDNPNPLDFQVKTEDNGEMVYKSLADVYGSANVVSYSTETEWKKETWVNGTETVPQVGENDVIMIRDTGEIIFGEQIYRDLMNDKAEFRISYEKKGFEDGDLRPEFFYHCKDMTDAKDASGNVQYPERVIEYNALGDNVPAERINSQGIEIQDINYTIAANTSLTINTQAGDVFDSNIGRDVDELINVVQKAIDAHDKVDRIKKMMNEVQYQDLEGADTHYQENLQLYLDVAQKEADYADDNLQKTYESYITHFENYMESTNIALANVGSTMDRLAMTQTRVENQKYTVEQLKTRNEDRDISDIIIDYYAAYNAYTASLTAAGKIGEQTLLNYL